MFSNHILEIIYLIASVTFIFGLKMMSNPKSARKGNSVAAVGMALAVFDIAAIPATSSDFL